MKNIILAGYGYWGKILYSKIINNPDYNLVAIINNTKIDSNVQVYSNINEACADNNIDSIIIATPASTHHNLLRDAMHNNLNIWIEKPIVDSIQNLVKLKDQLNSYDKTILVDHTFLSTSAFKKLKELINNNFLGEIYKVDSIRTDFGLFQQDVSIFYHLMYHDFYIIDELFHLNNITNLHVNGNSVIYPPLCDSANVSLNLKNIKVNIKCDMGFAEKKRYFQIWGSNGIIVWDETKQNKLIYYKYKIDVSNGKIKYFKDSVVNIKIPDYDALNNRLNDFTSLEIKSNIQQSYKTIELCNRCEILAKGSK